MWIFTNAGFVSVVSNGNDLMIRARDRESLEPIAESDKLEIIATPENDYPYRIFVSHEFFATYSKKRQKTSKTVTFSTFCTFNGR